MRGAGVAMVAGVDGVRVQEATGDRARGEAVVAIAAMVAKRLALAPWRFSAPSMAADGGRTSIQPLCHRALASPDRPGARLGVQLGVKPGAAHAMAPVAAMEPEVDVVSRFQDAPPQERPQERPQDRPQ